MPENTQTTGPVSGESTDQMTLEQALDRLEEISSRLEEGELELDESLALYEEGVRLLRRAETVLRGAEERIQHLRADGDGFRMDPLPEET